MALNLLPRYTVESFEGLDLVKHSTYGAVDKVADVVLLCPHAGNSRQLVRKLDGAFEDDSDVVEEYLGTDVDYGSDALVHAIARDITAVSGDLRTDVVEVMYERGIVDPNRVPKEARRNVLSYSQISKHADFLGRMHDRTLEIVDRVLAQIDKSKGLFLDVHSMAPYSPKDVMGEHPGRLKAYNFAYGRSHRGARRYIDLITAIPGEGTIANPILFGNVQSALNDASMDFRQNNPYPKPGYPAKNVMGFNYMLDRPGLALDFPKDNLSVGEAENDHWNIANLEVDGNKVERIAEVLAKAVLSSLQKIRARG